MVDLVTSVIQFWLRASLLGASVLLLRCRLTGMVLWLLYLLPMLSCCHVAVACFVVCYSLISINLCQYLNELLERVAH